MQKRSLVTEFLLARGHRVLGIDNFSSGSSKNLDSSIKNPNFSLNEIDVSKAEEVGALSGTFDFVFHLAALAEIVPSIQNPTSYFESNVIGTFNICQKARELSVKKFIYSASSSCYGIPSQFPTSETALLDPQYPYALTKHLGEQIVLHWQKVYQLPAVSLRLFNVYGPRARTSGSYGAVMGVFIAQMLANMPLTIVGDGEQTRDFTFISDVVSAIYAAANTGKIGAIYNVGSGIPRKVNELAKLIGNNNSVFVPKRPGEPEQTFADISKTCQELNWQPKISLEEGVSIVLESKSHWENAPVWTPEGIVDATSAWFKYLGSKSD
jgi:UDP-glucose 4-epimerase